MSDLSQIKSMQGLVSNEEWRTRVDLAACYRLVHHYGMDDLVYNHISARVPGEEEHFLINAYGMMYDEITASSLVKIDFEGKVVQDSGTGSGMAVSALDCGLLAVGPTVAEAFTNPFWLERACKAQVAAMSCNAKLRLPPQEVVEKTNHLYRPETRRRWGPLEWPALLRLADRKYPGFRA